MTSQSVYHIGILIISPPFTCLTLPLRKSREPLVCLLITFESDKPAEPSDIREL